MTFLFTDLEGSTRLWEERPDQMLALVGEHDKRVKAAIAAHGGYVFSPGGDGFGAAFGTAADAVAAAVQAQADIAGLPDISARMAINTGEVQERDGNYFGPPVNRTARLMAAGHGGQVLISAVTAELVPGLTLRNLGEHRLRDLGSPILIWQLGTDEFPPLRTLDELPGNLPVQRTSFIGRADEVKELAELVTNERLVTLTGPGGVGKSRLALQVGAEVAPEFRDGVWFASLATLEEGALIGTTILESLGVPERRGEPALDTLCGWTDGREALVLFDNCEHLLAEVAEVVDRVVDASTTVAVLTTSQSPLGVRGEHAWAVVPLSGPSGVSGDSIELFVDRARMARADFTLTAENEGSVTEICDRLDHVPLAIELAAARVRGMSPADIARRLDQRLQLLSSSDRLAPGRHRTLDAAVRWSYELLDDTERRVFDRLSVFAGPFTIEAAEAVVTGDDVADWEVLDSIFALVDKSLVIAEEADGATRYRLLETMRQFGHANIATAGVVDAVRARHGDYYASYVLSRLPRLHGADDIAARAEVEREFENLRVVLRQAADDRTSARFEELYFALNTIWVGRDRGIEGSSWASELVGRPDLDSQARVVALSSAAMVTNNTDLATAQELAEAAYDLATATGTGSLIMAVSAKALVAFMQGDGPTAVELSEMVLRVAGDETDLFVRALALLNCYAVFAISGALDRLDAVDREMSLLHDQLENRYLRASWMSSRSPIIHLTDPDGAGDYLHRAYELNSEIGNSQSNASHAMFLALHHLRSRDVGAAAQWAQQALTLAIDYAPTFIAQEIDTVVAIIKRPLPIEASILLGALRSCRARRHQAGTPPEVTAEARYEESLRKVVGDDFDASYAQGYAFDDATMIAFAFTQLDTVINVTLGSA